jgi:SAM-dependent methyltransferase
VRVTGKGLLRAAAAAAVLGVAVAAASRYRRQRRAPGSSSPAAWPPDGAELLACPTCRGVLRWQEEPGQWYCRACARGYPVRDGIVHFVEPAELGPLDRRFAHLYDWFSWCYPAFTRAGFALIGRSEARGRTEILDRLDPRGGRLLEVSVGPGSNLPLLVHRPDVGEVHALDISIGQLRRARALVRRRGWRVPLYLASGEALPFGDAVFDAVLHIGGINFFDDRASALAEMARVAKPGARVVVVDENERTARGYERTLPGFASSFDGERAPVSAPVADLPANATQVSVTDVWRGWFYCLEFVAAAPAAAATVVPGSTGEAP